MRRLRHFIDRFFRRVESTPDAPPTDAELIDGKAFAIRHYPMAEPVYATVDAELLAWITEDGERIAEIREPIGATMLIDTISTIRFNDALGFKHAVGALFGERKR